MQASPPNNGSPSKEEIQKNLWKGIYWGTASIILLGILGFILFNQEWVSPELWQAIENADHGRLLFGWSLMCLAIFVLGYRWKALLPNNQDISGGFLGISLGGALLLNYAVPGPFGELVAAWVLRKRHRTSIAIGLTTGGVARLLGLLTAAFGTLVLWFFVELSLQESRLLLWVLVLGIGLGAGLLLALFLLPQKMLGLVSKTDNKLSSLLKTFLESIISCTENGIKPFFLASIWSIIGHGVAVAGIWFSLNAIIPTESVIGVLFTYLAGTCCGVIAFLIPGSQLAWDAIFAGLLTSSTTYSIEEAILLTGILRIEQLGMMIVGGLGFFALIFQDKRSDV
jgi:uncharacterized membrane protein YbhN (UPF0104 family)